MKSGLAASSSLNSSQMISRLGIGASGSPAGAGLLVLVPGDVVAGRAQQLLPAHHLAGERVLHPVDQRQLVGRGW